MKIERDKCYRTRGGLKARVVCTDRKSVYSVLALIGNDKSNVVEDVVYLLSDGRFRPAEDNALDIVAEWADTPQKSDADLIEWLETQAKESRSGISFDWVPAVENGPTGFRFMRRYYIGEPCKTLRSAIAQAMEQEGGFSCTSQP